MKLNESGAEFCAISEEELFFSGKDLAELLRETIAKGHLFRFKAKGFSMCPFIRDGDIITVSPLTDEKIGFGEIIAFIHPDTDKLVVHRVVGKSQEKYFIKGDNVFKPDGLILKERILGCVTRIERGNKKNHLGLGAERFLTGWLNRSLFLFVLCSVWRWAREGVNKIFKCQIIL